MVLQKTNFYIINSFLFNESSINALCVINDTHPIFEGHFPGQPVVPGVCMVQMIKELIEQALVINVCLKKISQIKYLRILVPQKDTKLSINIDIKNDFTFNATLMETDVVIMKMSGIFES